MRPKKVRRYSPIPPCVRNGAQAAACAMRLQVLAQ